MKIIAITTPGHEFLYERFSAHKASDRSADIICSVLNRSRAWLRDGQIWHVYTVDDVGLLSTAACYQQFTIRSGKVYHKLYR